jgi:malonyl-CoA O-methyltransferase
LDVDLASSIRRSFEEAAADEEHFPSTIDPRIFHVKLLLRHLGDCRGGRVLDLGCGKGRFGRLVAEANPGVRLVALDLALAMLRHAPASLHRVAASMLALPFPDRSFDGLYATESLEHAVDIEGAISEMYRVLAPGGRLLIIDKNAEQWGRLETPAWEKWFHREEILRLLHCRGLQADCVPISYWEDVPPDGLFLAWLARRP